MRVTNGPRDLTVSPLFSVPSKDSLMVKVIYMYFSIGYFWCTMSSAQGLLLALYSGITPGGVQGILCGSRNQS